MSKTNLDLCYQLLNEYYGRVVACVCKTLLQNKLSPLSLIVQKCGYHRDKVKQALACLIQQNLVGFVRNKGIILYEADPAAVLCVLRYPQYVHCAKTLFGDAAELLVEEILLQGQARLGVAVEKTTTKLNDALAASGVSHEPISASVVRDKATTLVKQRLIRRCHNIIKDNDKTVGLSLDIDPEELFVLPTAADFEVGKPGSKHGLLSKPEVTAKKIKLENGAALPVKTEELSDIDVESSLWCINTHQFHYRFRDLAIIAAVKRTIDQRASDVVRTLLRLCETRSDPTWEMSAEISYNNILNSMPKDKFMLGNLLDQYLKCLSESCSNFVTRCGDSGGGLYRINYKKAMKALAVSQIETIIQERFGSKALRLFRVVLDKNHIEQKQLEELAMLPPKEAKDIMYLMFAENFITLSELSKTPDHAPSRTYYLFHVNLIQISRMLLERCYKTVSNLLMKRQQCKVENKRLLDKEERVDAIIASLDGEMAEQQKEEVQQMITPSERAQLVKLNDANKKLKLSEIEVDKTIFILEAFLNYTLKAIPTKK